MKNVRSLSSEQKAKVVRSRENRDALAEAAKLLNKALQWDETEEGIEFWDDVYGRLGHYVRCFDRYGPTDSLQQGKHKGPIADNPQLWAKNRKP